MNKPGAGHKPLDMFAGKWKTEGTVKASGDKPELKVSGTDTYRWLDGGFFLIHEVDVLMGNEKNVTIEIIAYDEAESSYTMHSYDNKGNSGRMKGSFDNGTWRFQGDTLRFKGKFSEDGKTLSGIWERQDDGKNWLHLMDIKLVKQEVN
jgi:hypothetical protein